MTNRFWAGVDLLLGGLLLLAAFMMGTFGYDWHLLGVLGVGFTIWGVIGFVRDSLKTK